MTPSEIISYKSFRHSHLYLVWVFQTKRQNKMFSNIFTVHRMCMIAHFRHRLWQTTTALGTTGRKQGPRVVGTEGRVVNSGSCGVSEGWIAPLLWDLIF